MIWFFAPKLCLWWVFLLYKNLLESKILIRRLVIKKCANCFDQLFKKAESLTKEKINCNTPKTIFPSPNSYKFHMMKFISIRCYNSGNKRKEPDFHWFFNYYFFLNQDIFESTNNNYFPHCYLSFFMRYFFKN